MKQVFTLPDIPPSVNTMFPTVGGRRVKSKSYTAWRTSAAWTIKAQHPEKVAGPVSVTIEMKRPTKNSDVDNRIKGALDVLTGIVFDDDKQVMRVTAAWVGDLTGSRITVETIG